MQLKLDLMLKFELRFNIIDRICLVKHTRTHFYFFFKKRVESLGKIKGKKKKNFQYCLKGDNNIKNL